MERLRKHYLVPLLMVMILFLVALALLLNIFWRNQALRADTVLLATPLRAQATAPQRLVTPAATYPPLELDLVQAAMRASDPGGDLRGRIESLLVTLTAPVPTVAGGPTWTPAPPATATEMSIVDVLTCSVILSGHQLRTAPVDDSPAREDLASGDEVVATGRSSDNLWLVVSLADGEIGWVAIMGLNCAGPVDGLAVVEP